jgi:hypothetical protein
VSDGWEQREWLAPRPLRHQPLKAPGVHVVGTNAQPIPVPVRDDPRTIAPAASALRNWDT